MGRPLLRNNGNFTKVESAVSYTRGHTVCYLAEIVGLGKPTVHRISKSDLKMSKASAKWVHRLSDDCGHLRSLNPASNNNIVKFSDVINNLNDVRRRVRPIAGKISAQTSLYDIFPSKLE